MYEEEVMSADAAGEVVGRFYDEFGAGDIDAALSVCADDLEIIDPGMGEVRGRDRFREYLETFKRAMLDARAIVEHSVEAGETVAVEGRFTGTHTGPLVTDDGEVEPTGAAVELRFADVSRVRDGKIVAYHTYYDQSKPYAEATRALVIYEQVGKWRPGPRTGPDECGRRASAST
jgi:ketosteroid isomerase-like protein